MLFWAHMWVFIMYRSPPSIQYEQPSFNCISSKNKWPFIPQPITLSHICNLFDINVPCPLRPFVLGPRRSIKRILIMLLKNTNPIIWYRGHSFLCNVWEVMKTGSTYNGSLYQWMEHLFRHRFSSYKLLRLRKVHAIIHIRISQNLMLLSISFAVRVCHEAIYKTSLYHKLLYTLIIRC